jgi:hypothetical protein
MNANELADELEMVRIELTIQAATMLRQQQAEIEALKQIIDAKLKLPEPRLTGKFSITAGKFKCTGCTGTWTDRDDAKHHSCKDYQ